MKKFISPLILICFIGSCFSSSKKASMQFIKLGEKEFNYASDSSFAIPHGKVWDERKRLHDSCIGSSYAANAIFIRTKDTFMLGSIVNRRTMKIVKTANIFDLGKDNIFSVLNILSTPCYEKRLLETSIDTFLKREVTIVIPGASKQINEELHHAIKNSIGTEIETGLWLNAELTDALGKIVDTSTNPLLLDYKKALLDTANMVLIRSSTITNVKFYFHSPIAMSKQLQAILDQKPRVTIQNSPITANLFLLNDKSFELNLEGFFQVMGQFMRCELQ